MPLVDPLTPANMSEAVQHPAARAEELRELATALPAKHATMTAGGRAQVGSAPGGAQLSYRQGPVSTRGR